MKVSTKSVLGATDPARHPKADSGAPNGDWSEYAQPYPVDARGVHNADRQRAILAKQMSACGG